MLQRRKMLFSINSSCILYIYIQNITVRFKETYLGFEQTLFIKSVEQ